MAGVLGGGLGRPFCGLVLAAAVYNQLLRGLPLDGGGKVARFATALWLATVAIALAAVQAWGRVVPGWIVLGALCGAAGAQLLYPLAETAVKLAILAGLVQPFGKGISNMSAGGWSNFGVAWLVWGVPGTFFALAARSFKRRRALSYGGGAAFMVLLGLLIG